MTVSFSFILRVAALLAFLAAISPRFSSKINTIALGLALWVLSTLIV